MQLSSSKRHRQALAKQTTSTPWLALFGIALFLTPTVSFAWAHLFRGACAGGVSFQWTSRDLVAVCPGPAAGGVRYTDPRVMPYSLLIQDVFDTLTRSGVGPTMQLGPSAPCVPPEDVAGSGNFVYPDYSAGNATRTFGIPQSLGVTATGTPVVGRFLDSRGTTGGAAGDFSSFACVPFRGADVVRYDLQVQDRQGRQLQRVTTWDGDQTWTTILLHELGHVLGMGGQGNLGVPVAGGPIHDDRWPNLLNSGDLVPVTEVAGVRIAGAGSASRVTVKPDGDMSQFMMTMGYSLPQYDYGVIAQAPARQGQLVLSIPTFDGLVTSSTTLTAGAVVFNHGVKWVGGEIFVIAYPESPRFDPILDRDTFVSPLPPIDLGSYLMPTVGNFNARHVLSQYTVGNAFLPFDVPIDAGIIAQMVPGQRYRLVYFVALPVGYVDADPTDNWVSTDIVIRRL